MDNGICRLCLNSISNLVNNSVDECGIPNETKIKFVMPEINLSVIPNLNLCIDCTESLNIAYTFKCECIQIEELIQECLIQSKVTSLTLEDVQIYRNKKNLNDNSIENIKLEIQDEKIEVDMEFVKKQDLDINLSCVKCSKTFEGGALFQVHNKELHYQNHMVIKANECEVCNQKFHEPQELNMHLLEKHPNKAATICNVCYKLYSSVRILQKHRLVHTAREKNCFCKVCGKSFYTMSHLRLHANIHKKQQYKCNICDRSFHLRSSLKRHSVNQHYKKFNCNICHLKYDSRSTLNKHYETHTIKNTHKCETCGKQFTRKDMLVIHTKCVHDNINIKSFKCKVCGKVFSNRSRLNKHMEHHIKSTENNRCTICSKTFKNLDRHVAYTHFSKYICNICNRKCSSNSALSDHMRTHTGDRPYKCEFCGKGFAQRGTLGVHIQCSHTKEKPYICETCGKAFTLKGSLTKHTIVHMPNLEKKFICEIHGCNRSFKTKRDRQDHMRRHIKGRCHPCTLCDKAFFDSTGLKRHMKCHTGEKPYECTTCHKSFSQQSNLRIHYRSHRPKDK